MVVAATQLWALDHFAHAVVGASAAPTPMSMCGGLAEDGFDCRNQKHAFDTGLDEHAWLAWGAALLREEDPDRKLAGWDALRDRMLQGGVPALHLDCPAKEGTPDYVAAVTDALGDALALEHPGVAVESWDILVGDSHHKARDPLCLENHTGIFLLARASGQQPKVWLRGDQAGVELRET